MALLALGVSACDDGPGSAKGPLGELDAGQHDGAVPDAGGEDGGPDAMAPADAGETDASEPDAGDPDAGDPDAGEHDAGEHDAGPPPFGGLVPNTPWQELEIDLLGTPGHRFWIEVGEQQLSRMNAGMGGGPGPIFDGLGRQVEAGDPLYRQLMRDMNPNLRFDPFGDDIYTPGHPATYADHVIVQDAESEAMADYGKMEVKLVGESTGRAWDFAHIPNVRIDTNEFEKGKRIGAVEHLRLNNGLVGSIFREVIAHRVYRELGYPALRGTWAFLGSSVWGHDVWVPMVLIEVYKRRFCEENAELLGGACQNMWEFPGYVGDPYGYGGDVPDSACQVDECDHTRLAALIDQLAATPRGAGFKQALDPYIDWERFHQFQCLSWMLWTGDDPIHNGNNNLIIERDSDGKLIWAPYSIDISAGQDWYTHVPLTGAAPIAEGCQTEPECWADTIAACEDLIEKFDALDPEQIVDDATQTLTELGMMRAGDARRAELLRQWYVERQLELPAELERFRYLPDELGNCQDGLELCGDGGCGTPEQCITRSCELGQAWCQSREACVDPVHDGCPVCSEQAPRFCHLDNQCVESIEVCWASCDAMGMSYCAAYDACVFAGECPEGEDGGGIVLPAWPAR